jgi:hypothetical protein
LATGNWQLATGNWQLATGVNINTPYQQPEKSRISGILFS